MQPCLTDAEARRLRVAAQIQESAERPEVVPRCSEEVDVPDVDVEPPALLAAKSHWRS